jgi:hypothetical protein
VKKLVTIGCLLALVISICGLPLFYAFQKQLHKQAQFNYIETHPQEKMEGLIHLTVKDVESLPTGFEWEEENIEFRFHGMMYDVVSIKKKNAEWIITALADTVEVSIEKTNQQFAKQDQENNQKAQKLFKWVFTPYISFSNAEVSIIYDMASIYFPMIKQSAVQRWAASPYLPPKVNA